VLVVIILFIYIAIDILLYFFFFFSSRRRHTRFKCDWSSDVCSSDLCKKGILPFRGELSGAGGFRRTIDWHTDIAPAEAAANAHRSEERRVGKECRTRWAT